MPDIFKNNYFHLFQKILHTVQHQTVAKKIPAAGSLLSKGNELLKSKVCNLLPGRYPFDNDRARVMDVEMLFSLLVLWFSTTTALIMIIPMWFFNEGESFHPHSVDVDHRHALFVVVHSNTHCKMDFAVRSISEFVAPRGSSSSKQFTVLCVMISISGFLGTFRWYHVGDGKFLEVVLSLIGFASLLLVASFELSVVPGKAVCRPHYFPLEFQFDCFSQISIWTVSF